MARLFAPLAVFLATLAGHYTYFMSRSSGCGTEKGITAYFLQGDVYVGFSIALGAAYTALSLLDFFNNRSRGSAAGAAGGTVLAVGAATFGCFFAGCCGSPMLIVYAGILGVSGLEIPKWCIPLFTFLCISLTWWFTRGKSQGCCSHTETNC